jgi:RimJ/RimL family protein N-acetyltransferase
MIHVNNCCPVERIDAIRLANGQRVVLRPALEQDLPLHGPYFDGLSNESRYNRFFNPTPKTTAKMLRHLLHIDRRSHVALLAEHMSGDKGMVIAEARYKVAADDGSAEFALSVADKFHGLGLGKLLLDRLVCAASRAGLGRLAGETLATNDRMLRLARKAGFALTSDPGLLYLVRLEKRLEASGIKHSCQDSNALDVRDAIAALPTPTGLLTAS